jgi:hypothetical protein
VLEDIRKTCLGYTDDWILINQNKRDGMEVTSCYARRRVTVFHMQITYIPDKPEYDRYVIRDTIQHTIFLNQRITLIHIVCIIIVARDVVDQNASWLRLEGDPSWRAIDKCGEDDDELLLASLLHVNKEGQTDKEYPQALSTLMQPLPFSHIFGVHAETLLALT